MLGLILLAAFATCIVPSLIALWFLPKSKPRLRYGLAVGLFATLVSPSFLAGGILAMPVPYGAVILSSVADSQPTLLVLTLRAWPIWHLVSFPVTALVGAILFAGARPNNSFK